MNNPDSTLAELLSTDVAPGCIGARKSLDPASAVVASRGGRVRLLALVMIAGSFLLATSGEAQSAPATGETPAAPKADPSPAPATPPAVALPAPNPPPVTPRPVAPSPVTPPVPAAPRPAPKQVALAAAAAIEKGDATALRALVLSEGISPELADATIALASALRRLDAAAATRFANVTPPVNITQGALDLTRALKAVEGAQEKIEGDLASLTLPANPAAQPLILRLARRGEDWRMDLTPAQGDSAATTRAAQRLLKLYDLLTKAADQTTAELSASQLTTPEEAAALFAGRVLRARAGID